LRLGICPHAVRLSLHRGCPERRHRSHAALKRRFLGRGERRFLGAPGRGLHRLDAHAQIFTLLLELRVGVEEFFVPSHLALMRGAQFRNGARCCGTALPRRGGACGKKQRSKRGNEEWRGD
jgi:hypothetical protein